MVKNRRNSRALPPTYVFAMICASIGIVFVLASTWPEINSPRWQCRARIAWEGRWLGFPPSLACDAKIKARLHGML